MNETCGICFIYHELYIYEGNNEATDGKMTILTRFDMWSAENVCLRPTVTLELLWQIT